MQVRIIHELLFTIFSLRLHKCKLEGDCCEALAVALCTESTQLRELDLSANDFQKSGVRGLCVGLCSHHCKLETLRLKLLLCRRT